jgi:threonine/homoserine/homoserine lactone efflux protein
MIPILIDGILTGLFLQLAIGPVFLYILNISLQRSVADGFVAVLAVTIVDYIYIASAIMGVGKILEKPKIKLYLGIISSIVLFLFGIVMIISAINPNSIDLANDEGDLSIFASFISVFLLTISSPLTIVFWTGLFASKAIEKEYTKEQLQIFGIGAGSATLLFLGSSVIMFSLIKSSVPYILLLILNISVGSLLIIYGTIRLIKTIKS